MHLSLHCKSCNLISVWQYATKTAKTLLLLLLLLLLNAETDIIRVSLSSLRITSRTLFKVKIQNKIWCVQFGKIKGMTWQKDAFSDDAWMCRVSQTQWCWMAKFSRHVAQRSRKCGHQSSYDTKMMWLLVRSNSNELNLLNPSEFRGNYSATSNNTKLVHWPSMGGLLHLVQRGGDWVGYGPAESPPCVPNVTAHPSMASAPITVIAV